MSETGARDPRARAVVVVLVVVLAWGALLRFTGITRSRLLLCDEAFYLLEARRIVGQARACATIWRIFRRDKPKGLIKLDPADRAEIERLAGEGYGQLGGRFGHDLLLAGALLAGLPEEWCGQWVAALFGTATLVWVALFCAARWGPRAGTFASICLAGSILHLTYSRSTLCESDCVFFITAALLTYAASHGRAGVALAGVLFGCAFVCNVRALPVAYALVAYEALHLRPRESLPRLVLFGAAAALPLVAAEALYHVVFLFSGATGVMLTRQTYVHTLLWQFFRLQGGLMEPGANPGHYPRYLLGVENPLLLVAYAAGAVWLIRRACLTDNSAERLLAVVAVFTGTYWQLAVGIKCLRYLAPLVPVLSIGAGLAIAALLARFDSPVITCATALALVGACSLAWAPWQGASPGYRESADWLAAQGHPRVVATQANYYRLRFPMADVEMASTFDALRELHRQGFRWYVDCFQKYHWPILPDLLNVQKELAKRAAPRLFAQPMAATPFTWFEGGHAQVPPEWNADAATIKIWDLDEAFRAAP